MSEENTITADIVPLPTPFAAALERIEATGVLLERPAYESAPDQPWVYALRGGRVGRCAMDRYRMPAYVRRRSLVLPSPVREQTVATLPFVAEVLDRMVPWVDVHVVPDLLRLVQDDGFSKDRTRRHIVGDRAYVGAGGVAYKSIDLIILAASSPTFLVSSAAHEAMHMRWGRFTTGVRRLLGRAALDGHSWPGEYLDDIEERVCRMFESWVMSYVEGLSTSLAASDEPSVALVFTRVCNGSFADELIRHGEVPNAEQLRRRRGLLPLPQPLAPTLLDRIGSWLTSKVEPLLA